MKFDRCPTGGQVLSLARVARGKGTALELLHTPRGHRIGPRVVCSDCGQDIDVHEA
jgi:hypothetical protein